MESITRICSAISNTRAELFYENKLFTLIEIMIISIYMGMHSIKKGVFYKRNIFSSVNIKCAFFKWFYRRKNNRKKYSKWRKIKQNAAGLNKGLSWNSDLCVQLMWSLRVHIFIKKSSQMVSILVVSQQTWVENTVHWVETLGLRLNSWNNG